MRVVCHEVLGIRAGLPKPVAHRNACRLRVVRKGDPMTKADEHVGGPGCRERDGGVYEGAALLAQHCLRAHLATPAEASGGAGLSKRLAIAKPCSHLTGARGGRCFAARREMTMWITNISTTTASVAPM